MRIRTRKLIGAVALLLIVILWSSLALLFAQIVMSSTNDLIANFYYALAGLGWLLPAMPLVWWMSHPDRPS